MMGIDHNNFIFSYNIVNLHKNDIPLIRFYIMKINNLKKQIKRIFRLTDLSLLNFLIGIEVIFNRSNRTFRFY